MNNLLLISSSPRGEASLSLKVANELVSELRSSYPGAVVQERNLVTSNIPHISPEFLGAIFTPEDAKTEEHKANSKLSDELLEELFAADTLVVAAGMINFGIPSVLKSWVDHVARAGKTFSYTETGPVPLLHNKKAYLVVATGGVYSDGPMAGFDYAEKYLRAVFGFFGITDVETIWVEGLALGPESAEKALSAASERVKDLVAV